MDTVFLACAFFGGTIVILQLVLGLVGFGGHELGFDHDGGVHGDDPSDALNLLSVRSVAAGLAFFGLAGLFARSHGLGPLLALPVGLAAGSAAAVAVALAMRQLLKLESDGAARIEEAVGLPATVYLSIPAGRSGAGKIHLKLQGRTVECQAISEHPLPTGASVLVMDIIGPDTVEVVPTPDLGIGGLLDAPR